MARTVSVSRAISLTGWIWLVACDASNVDLGGPDSNGESIGAIGGSGSTTKVRNASESGQGGGAAQAAGGTATGSGGSAGRGGAGGTSTGSVANAVGGSSGVADCNGLAGSNGSGVSGPFKMAVGENCACWIRTNGTLWCWGYASVGTMSPDGSNEDRDPNVPVQIGNATWLEVAAASHHMCGIQTDGTLWCSGSDPGSPIGSAPPRQRGAFSLVDANPTWRAVSTQTWHSCGIGMDGTLWCWGVFPLPDGGSSDVPVQIGEETSWVSVENGLRHTCAIRQDDSLWCWGENKQGQLGDRVGGATESLTPTRVGTSDDWLKVSAGRSHTCGIQVDGSLWCWGEGSFLESEIASVSDPSAPHRIGRESDWIDVLAGSNHTCGIRRCGTLWCWGDNRYGQLGDGSVTNRAEPFQVGTEATWAGVFGGDTSLMTCGIRTDGAVFCWGDEYAYDLSVKRSKIIWEPRRVPDPEPWLTLAGSPVPSQTHVCGIRDDHSLWCWGENFNGELGNGTLGKLDEIGRTPTQVSPGTTWANVSANFYHTCGIRTDGSLWCWGSNGDGQLGNGNLSVSVSATPIQIEPSATWTMVATAASHTCGIRTDGSLWCWGWNPYGQLGTGGELGTETKHPAPEQVAPGTTWKAVSTRENHTCGIRTDNSLWCWGQNGDGQLGDGTQTDYGQSDWDIPIIHNRSVPTLVLGNAAWNSVAAGTGSTFGIRTDGSLWGWGANEDGKLGIGNTATSLVPVQVGTDTNWAKVYAAGTYACGIRTDRSLWCWGNNGMGELGIGNTGNRLVPARVGTESNWIQVFLSEWSIAASRADGSLWFWGENTDQMFGITNIPMILVGAL